MSPNIIGEKIRTLRSDQSLREFGKKCDISHTTIDNLEKGIDFRTGKPVQVKMATLEKIANACNISISYFLDEEKCKMLKFKDLRIEQGLSTESLASCIGISKEELFLYEEGEKDISYDLLIKIADVLNVTLDNIFGRVVYPKNSVPKNRVKTTRRMTPFSDSAMAKKLDLDVEVYRAIEANRIQLTKNIAIKMASLEEIDIDYNFIMGARYRLILSQNEWTREQIEDFPTSSEEGKEAIIFKNSKGVCEEFEESRPLFTINEYEKNLLQKYRNTDDEGRIKITQSVENIFVERQRDAVLAKNTSNVG